MVIIEIVKGLSRTLAYADSMDDAKLCIRRYIGADTFDTTEPSESCDTMSWCFKQRGRTENSPIKVFVTRIKHMHSIDPAQV